ncbi:hypothetical protein QR685DRAFT_483907 [Neurospora intermedia]|uniref:Uncharacterized protein n=1 Tax=Neurospora intermedia TaxID=5142 RepID=A0ABR3CZY7_NEUIN
MSELFSRSDDDLGCPNVGRFAACHVGQLRQPAVGWLVVSWLVSWGRPPLCRVKSTAEQFENVDEKRPLDNSLEVPAFAVCGLRSTYPSRPNATSTNQDSTNTMTSMISLYTVPHRFGASGFRIPGNQT